MPFKRVSAEAGAAPAHAPLTWSIASCAITIAPFISFCCDGESGGHSAFEPGIRSALLEATDRFGGA